MNQVLLNLMPGRGGSPAEVAAAGAKTTALAVGADFFRAALAARLLTAVPAKSRHAGSVADDIKTQAALEANVAKMIESGASQADIIASLAGQLASAAAHLLGLRGADARGALQTVFATALAPPGESGEAAGSVADRARMLAQRYIRLEGLASSIAGGRSGQQNRITGNLLDAQRAKDIPARTATTDTNTPATSMLERFGLQRSGAIAPIDAAATAPASPAGARAVAVLSASFQEPARNPASNAAAGLPLRAVRATSGTCDVPGRTVQLGTKLVATSDLMVPLVQRSGAVAQIDSARSATTSPAGPRAVDVQLSSGHEPASAGAGLLMHVVPPMSVSGDRDGRTVTVELKLAGAGDTAPAANAGAGFWLRAVPPAAGGGITAPAAATVRRSGAIPQSDAALPSAEVRRAALSAGAGPVAAKSSSSREQAANAGAGLPLGAVRAANVDGDGEDRTVELGATTASRIGADATLGRVLTRVAADARQAPVAPSADGVPSTAAAAGDTRSAGGPSDAVVLAFVKEFEAALNAGTPADAERPVPHDAHSAAALFSLTAHQAAPAPAALPSSVAPFTIDRADLAAASAPAPAAAAHEHGAIADQVLRGAFMRNVGESSEIRLTLVPNSLGDVTVKLVVNAGSVTAHVLAQTPEVRDAIVAAQPQLTKSLAEAGLKLASFTVDLSSGGFAGFSQQQNDQSQNGNRSRRSTSSADGDGDGGSDDLLLEAIPSFGPSIVAQPHVGDYNYLA